MKSAEKIEQLVKKIRFSPRASANERILGYAEAALKQRVGKAKSNRFELNIGRIIMKSKITKLAAAAAIIIAVLFGINQFGGSLDMADVAWADLAERVGRIQTCTFQGHSSLTDSDSEEINQEIKMFVSSKHGFRADTYAGEKLSMMQYMLPTEKVIISVIPEQKKYFRMLLTDEHLEKMRQQGYGDPREMVRQFMSVEYTELGRDIIGGIEVEGIETSDPRYSGGTFENFVARLWVDVETDLPVQLEMEMQMDFGGGQLKQMSMVMDTFEWNVDIEPSILEPNIPSDYTLMAEMKLPGQDEGSAVEGLRLFAEIADGNYPNEINVMKIFQEVSKVMKVNFGKPGLGDDSNNKPSQEEQEKMMKRVTENVMIVQGACMFYAELVKQDKDPAYYGNTVTAGDVDAVLMRWKVSENEYRVIFGDLTTENISANQLAELEKPFSRIE